MTRIELELTARHTEQLREIMENQSIGMYADLIVLILSALPRQEAVKEAVS